MCVSLSRGVNVIDVSESEYEEERERGRFPGSGNPCEQVQGLRVVAFCPSVRSNTKTTRKNAIPNERVRADKVISNC